MSREDARDLWPPDALDSKFRRKRPLGVRIVHLTVAREFSAMSEGRRHANSILQHQEHTMYRDINLTTKGLACLATRAEGVAHTPGTGCTTSTAFLA